MNNEELLEIITKNLNDKLKIQNPTLKFNIEIKKYPDCITSEFIQKERTIPFFCLMKSLYDSIEVFFLPTKNEQALCDMWYNNSIYSPEISIGKLLDNPIELSLFGNGLTHSKSFTIEEVVDFIYEKLNTHINS